MTKAKTNKFQLKTVSNADTLKSYLHKNSATVTKYFTVIDLTDDFNTKEYITEVTSVIEIIDLTD
jgi:ATP-dependent Clp protease adapter protein ClpS